MKRLLGPLAFVLLTSPALAQDVDFGAFNDLPAPPPPAAARGAATGPARGAPTPPPAPDRLVRLRELLLTAEAPLTKEQETALNTLINTEIPLMQKTIKAHGQEMMASRPAPAPPAGAPPVAGVPPAAAPAPPAPSSPTPAPPNPAAAAAAAAAARGGALPPGLADDGARGAPSPAMLAAMAAARGASPSSRVPADVLDALEVEMRKMNDDLFLKIASAPALDAKQQAVLVKMSRDQIKSRGGYEALRLSMEDAKAPFSEEQTPKVLALFEDQKVARAELVKAADGTPDPAKLKQLETATLAKVLSLLTPAQRTALTAMLRPAPRPAQ
jgi:hypothetical protein